MILTFKTHFQDKEIKFKKTENKKLFAFKTDNQPERFYFFSKDGELKGFLERKGILADNRSLAKKDGVLIISNAPDRKALVKNIPYKHLKNFFLPLDINSATADDFIELPGIGVKKSNEILKFRGKIGGFNSISQLLEVKGIGLKTYDKIKTFITVRG